MSDQEEHDHEAPVLATPVWEWNWLEVPAIVCRVIAGTARCVGEGLDDIALELQAAAEHRRTVRQREREQWAQDVARAEMAGYLEAQVLFDEPRAIDPQGLA